MLAQIFSQMHVQVKHSLAHLQDLIPTLAGNWLKLTTCFPIFYCDSYFLSQIRIFYISCYYIAMLRYMELTNAKIWTSKNVSLYWVFTNVTGFEKSRLPRTIINI